MTSMAKDETLGRREVDNDKNIGNLLCPCCSSRMVTERGTLVERHGDEQTLWIPRPSKSSEDAEETLTWEQDTHQWWWSIPDIDDFSNVGLSRLVESPAGPIKIVLCSECQSGPYGYTTESSPIVWLCCELLKQVDASLANDEEDFKAPNGIDVEALRGMIASGALTTQFHVTFEEQRLGMMLADAEDENGVEVVAFTEYEGELGPAELGGDIQMSDKVIRVNGTSTSGLDYAAVLTMVIEASRPITLHFERNGNKQRGGGGGGGGGGGDEGKSINRVVHKQWDTTGNLKRS